MNGTVVKECKPIYTIKAENFYDHKCTYVHCEDYDEARKAYIKAVTESVPAKTLKNVVDSYHGCIDLNAGTYKLSDLLFEFDPTALRKEAEYILGVEFDVDVDVDIGYDKDVGGSYKSCYQDAVRLLVNLKAEDGTILWIESEWNGEGYKYASDDEANAWVVKGDGETYRAVMVRDPTEPLADMEEDIGDWMFTLGLFRIEGACLQYERMEFVHDYIEYLQKCAELELDGYTAFRPAIDTERCELDRAFIKESE